MTAAKIMDIISRLPGCALQGADAVSAHTQGKNGRCLVVFKISQFGVRHKWRQSVSSMEDPVVPLDRNLYGCPLTGLFSKGNLIKFYSSPVGRFPLGNAYSYAVKKGYSYLCM